jgi:hypothetical protein
MGWRTFEKDPANGRRDYPDFGRYTSENQFKALVFVGAARRIDTNTKET